MVNAGNDEEHDFCCDISVDGTRVATTSPDKRVLVWKIQTPYILASTHNCLNQRQSQVKYTEPKKGSKTNQHTKKNVKEREEGHPKEAKISLHQDDSIMEIASQSVPLEGVIDHIICQLDTITSTMIKLEKRLSIQEENISALQSQINRDKTVSKFL